MSTPAARCSCCSAATSARSRRPARVAAGRELGLAERDHVLGQRQPLDDAPQPRDRRARPLEPREPGVSAAGKSGDERQRALEGAPRRAVPPAAPLELAEQRAHVGVVLRRGAAGGDGEPHRLRGAVEVAVQLAQVGDPRVAGEVRLAVDHRLQLALGLVVAAELDQRVDADRRAGVPGAAAELQRAGEVVAGERQLARGRRARPACAASRRTPSARA